MAATEEYEIINLVVTIFQNVGIKRIIDKIDILKNYQIYLEICKVIFPQTMIQLLRISQGPKTNAQKIQGVVDIVGKILQNDLYHISGQAIAEGKLNHIKNFLHILELLSQNVHKGNRNQEEVQSAPQNTRSISDYDQDGHYTVIGIDRQFQRQFQDEEGIFRDKKAEQEKDTKRQYPNINGNDRNQYECSQTDDSQSEGPMNPILDKKQQSQKKKFVKTKPKGRKATEKINIRQVVPKIFQKTNYPNYTKSKKFMIPKLEDFLKKDKKQQTRKKFKSQFIKKINNVIQNFEAKNITDLKLEHNIWVRQHQINNSQKENQIQNENKERIQFANELIIERKKKVDTLRNIKWAGNAMFNLFIQQRQVWRGMKRAKQQSQLEQIQALIQGQQMDEQLLRQALIAGNPQNFIQRKK